MIIYGVSNLDSKTTDEQRVLLARNLEAVAGIETVRVHPNRGEIVRRSAAPPEASIKKAVSDSGFGLGSIRK